MSHTKFGNISDDKPKSSSRHMRVLLRDYFINRQQEPPIKPRLLSLEKSLKLISDIYDGLWAFEDSETVRLTKFLVGVVDPMDLQHYRKIVKILYPHRSDKFYETLELAQLKFSNGKFSAETLEERMKLMLKHRIEPNFYAYDYRHCESLTLDQFLDVIPLVLPGISKDYSIKRYQLAELDYGPNKVSIHRVAQIFAYLFIHHLCDSGWNMPNAPVIEESPLAQTTPIKPLLLFQIRDELMSLETNLDIPKTEQEDRIDMRRIEMVLSAGPETDRAYCNKIDDCKPNIYQPNVSGLSDSVTCTFASNMSVTVENIWNSKLKESEPAATDSITLNQLKSLVKDLPKKSKQEKYLDFEYSDVDCLEQEINELYSYNESLIFEEGRKLFENTFNRGIIAEAQDHSTQIECIIQNNTQLRAAGAIEAVYSAFRVACSNLDIVIKASPSQHEESSKNNSQRQHAIERANLEIAIYLNLMYMMIEVNWRQCLEASGAKEKFATEIHSLEPMLSVYLFQQITQMSDGQRKGFPVKKLLLLLWKVLLITLGGSSDIFFLKALARKAEGLDPIPYERLDGPHTKATPQDYFLFYNEVSLKYPSIPVPSPPPPFSSDCSSTMQRRSFSTRRRSQLLSSASEPLILPFTSAGSESLSGISEKIGNNRYSTGGVTDSVEIPKPIHEAVDAYFKWMHVTVSPLQIEREKKLLEKCKANKRYDFRSADEISKMSKFESSHAYGSLIDSSHAWAQKRSVLPQMTQIIVSLLKLLLAGSPIIKNYQNGVITESAKSDSADDNRATLDMNIPNDGNMSLEQLALATLEVNRHREIVTKYTLLFEYVCQLLVDANCILLILKVLNFQDFTHFLTAQNDVDDMNFFKFQKKPSDPSKKTVEEAVGPKEIRSSGSDSTLSDQSTEEIVQLDPTPLVPCWRNFFSTINLLRVLQKLTKGKVNRVLILLQHKSSAILKRIIKIQNQDLQRYALKLIKSQVPFAGRKWRQSELDVLTAPIMSSHPNDFMVSSDPETETDQASNQDSLYRTLTASYHSRNYPEVFGQSTNDQKPTDIGNRDEDVEDEINRLIQELSLSSADFPDVSQMEGNQRLFDDAFYGDYEEWLRVEVLDRETRNTSEEVSDNSMNAGTGNDVSTWKDMAEEGGEFEDWWAVHGSEYEPSKIISGTH
ncbi:hypothetical protein BKA69DRAFT_1039459 [Paraphysoderma sedebokerense]|nr:hypothetical protein BKA69DRAFT_1039459 [Paraphysoderma sedebokerense]